jgi:hypothetical protein
MLCRRCRSGFTPGYPQPFGAQRKKKLPFGEIRARFGTRGRSHCNKLRFTLSPWGARGWSQFCFAKLLLAHAAWIAAEILFAARRQKD